MMAKRKRKPKPELVEELEEQATGADDVEGDEDAMRAEDLARASEETGLPIVGRSGKRLRYSLSELQARKHEIEGLICRNCGCRHFRTVDTRKAPGMMVRRKRVCRHCGTAKLTYEKDAGSR